MTNRYHPALAALIGFSLVMGFLVLAPMANSSPDKIFVLRAHMIAGFAILTLMLVRFAVRLGTPRPAPVATGSPLLNGLAAAGFHQLVLRDRLLSRMGIAKS